MENTVKRTLKVFPALFALALFAAALPLRAYASTGVVTITYPGSGADYSSGGTGVDWTQGTASTASGIYEITEDLWNETEGGWLQANGTYSTTEYNYETLLTTSGCPGVSCTSSGWYSNNWAPLETGIYQMCIVLTAEKYSGDGAACETFYVGPEDLNPVVNVTSPNAGHAFGNGNLVHFAGNASSPAGVVTVNYAIKDTTTGDWVGPGFAMEAHQYWVNANPSCSGSSCTAPTWTVAAGDVFFDLPAGSYAVQAQVTNTDEAVETSSLKAFTVTS